MPPTAIIECNNCSGLLLASITQKTRICPYCGARVDLHKAKPLASAENAFEASEMLRRLKAQKQSNTRKPKSKPREHFFPEKSSGRKTN